MIYWWLKGESSRQGQRSWSTTLPRVSKNSKDTNLAKTKSVRWKINRKSGAPTVKENTGVASRGVTGSLWLLYEERSEGSQGRGGRPWQWFQQVAGGSSEGGEESRYFRGLSGDTCCQAAYEVWQRSAYGPQAFWGWYMSGEFPLQSCIYFWE